MNCDEMFLVVFHSLELGLAELAGELCDGAMGQLMHPQRPFSVQALATLWTGVFGGFMNIDVMGQRTRGLEFFAADRAATDFGG